MQARRSHATVPALAIVLPHPALPRRRSSLLSASSPRTPLNSCGSPSCSSLFLAPSRKSTDSWNSSINEVDDCEWEWTQEQVLLLRRTLDALPEHLITPFHGPVPPANLLDKLARGVAQAKGAVDWPHSIRATRAKLLELARATDRERGSPIPEESAVEQVSKENRAPRRPLYRQSSMDFITSEKLGSNVPDDKLSNSHRLRRSERLLASPSYHPYVRPTRSSVAAGSIRPESFSSLSSMSSVSSRYPGLRRTPSVTSDSSFKAPDPRLQRVRRSESFCAQPSSSGTAGAPTARHSLKRAAPQAQPHSKGRPRSGSTSSTDEEEKARKKKVRKVVRKSATPPPAKSPASPPTPKKAQIPVPPSPRTQVKATKKPAKSLAKAPSDVSSASTSTSTSTSASSSSRFRRANSSSSATTMSSASESDCASSPPPTPVRAGTTPSPTPTPKQPTPKQASVPRPRANLQRNPSIFGAPLPTTSAAATVASPTSPTSPRTLRRVRPIDVGRRISFGASMPEQAKGARAEREQDRFAQAFGLAASAAVPEPKAKPKLRVEPVPAVEGLGSAFEMH